MYCNKMNKAVVTFIPLEERDESYILNHSIMYKT